jgi:hypothetical protein
MRGLTENSGRHAPPPAALAALRAAVGRSLGTLRHDDDCQLQLPERCLQLARRGEQLYLQGDLALARPLQDAAYARLCALALAGAAYFAAVLSCGADSTQLKFVRRLSRDDSDALLQAVEQMLNQIDVWQSLLEAEPERGWP